MANLMEIPCPECDKQMKLPEEMAGKKVRCKACGHVFRVEAETEPVKTSKGDKAPKPSVKAKPLTKPPGKGKAGPKAATKPKGSGDLDEDGNPYGLTEEYLGPRCAFCAAPMEEGDIICLACGYNTSTRQKQFTKKVFQRTGVDWFLWLFPATLCVITILVLVGLDVWYVMKVPGERELDDYIIWAVFNKGVKLWVVIATMFAMFFCGVYAFRRFVFHPLPPERERQDARNMWVILGTLALGLLILVGTSAWFLVLLINGYIPNPILFAMLFSTGFGMVSGILQYNV
jgi:Zn ribbon nucleic-acid-binding protein